MRSEILNNLLNDTPKEAMIYVDLYADLVIRIEEILKEKGISKKTLADSSTIPSSEISRWLRGNLEPTLHSLALLEAELGEKLLEVPKIRKKLA